MAKKHYRFYMDESETSLPRQDSMNCFCFAGVLIAEEDIDLIRKNHKEFCEKWGITYPLHNVHIRGRRNNFDWLNQDSSGNNRNAVEFINEYHEFMTDQPYKIFGFAIEKTVYAKSASSQNEIQIAQYAFHRIMNRLIIYLKNNELMANVYIEESAKQDRILKKYYNSFATVYDRKDFLFERLHTVKKDNPFTQIADFCAFALAKEMYEKNYRPFKLLEMKNKISSYSNRIEGLKIYPRDLKT